MSLTKAYLGTLLSFLVIDAVWIALFVQSYYEQAVGALLRETPNAAAAGVFYLAYAGGIVYLAVRPALAEGSIRRAALNGAVTGGLAYGTYTVTNFAIFSDWTMGLLVSDVVWGMFLTATTAVCGYFAARL